MRIWLIAPEVGDEAGTTVTLYGQEKDVATAGLARMNMILHNNPTAAIHGGHRRGSAALMHDSRGHCPSAARRWRASGGRASSILVGFARGREGARN
jgi:N-6 DNA Methylase